MSAEETTAHRRIELDGVDVDYGDRQALRAVSVVLEHKRIAVVGANGSGKSTFARLLNGLVPPTAGNVRVHGRDSVRDRREIRSFTGFVFTNPDAQILMPTVAEDVALSLRGRGLAREAIAARVDEVLTRYGLSGHRDAPAYSLSGGQKQLLALCSVLVTEPALVIADEPTTLLDLRNARRIGALLTEELDAQTVLVTHDLELASRCDVALLFEEGELIELGDPAEIVALYRSRVP